MSLCSLTLIRWHANIMVKIIDVFNFPLSIELYHEEVISVCDFCLKAFYV